LFGYSLIGSGLIERIEKMKVMQTITPEALAHYVITQCTYETTMKVLVEYFLNKGEPFNTDFALDVGAIDNE
jgi:hypothetical protein